MSKKAVFAFGRMNPPTSGHEKLANKVRAVARQLKGDPLIYLSHKQDKKKDPLQYTDKIKYAQTAFGKIVIRTTANTIIKVMQELEGKGYTDVVLVVGSDRVDSFRKLLGDYNGKDYTFESIEIVSAGERDPDADGVEGMSASKMRELARSEDLTGFTEGLPDPLKKQADKIMSAVRKGMGIYEKGNIL